MGFAALNPSYGLKLAERRSDFDSIGRRLPFRDASVVGPRALVRAGTARAAGREGVPIVSLLQLLQLWTACRRRRMDRAVCVGNRLDRGGVELVGRNLLVVSSD